MMREFTGWFRAQPFSTKWLLVLSAATPILMTLGIVKPHFLVYDWPSIRSKFQIWRLFTALFLTRTDLSLLFSLFLRFQYSYYLETINFVSQPADYLYFLFLSTLALCIGNIYLGMATLWESFTMVLLYVWAQYNKTTIVNFWFGFKFQAVYLPAVMAALEFLSSGSIYGSALGIVVGHLYYFVKEIYSQQNPAVLNYLTAPLFLRTLVKIAPQRATSAQGGDTGFTVTRPAAMSNTLASSGAESTTASSSSSSRIFSGRAQKLGGD